MYLNRKTLYLKSLLSQIGQRKHDRERNIHHEVLQPSEHCQTA